MVRTTTENKKPVHDEEISDMRSAVENMCVNLPKIFRNQSGDFKTADQKSFASAIIKSIRI